MDRCSGCCATRCAVFLQRIRIDPRITFVVMATILAMVEEAITTTLTNLAPLFGVPYGSAYITASGNYFDVVCLHSVVVFVPMFIGWSFLLQRYSFSPNAVFLLFGLTGLTAELSFSGPQAFLQFGLWIFVYGLMVFGFRRTPSPRSGARANRRGGCIPRPFSCRSSSPFQLPLSLDRSIRSGSISGDTPRILREE